MMLGREVTVPLDIHFGDPLMQKEIQTDYTHRLQEDMERMHKLAR